SGFKFRRQVPIGPFVADFVCFEARLVIELDGTQHADSASDAWRDRWLHDDDFRVLRIWNADLFRNRTSVLETIWHALHPSSVSAPSRVVPLARPSPLAGEGAAHRAAGEGASDHAQYNPSSVSALAGRATFSRKGRRGDGGESSADAPPDTHEVVAEPIRSGLDPSSVSALAARATFSPHGSSARGGGRAAEAAP